MKPHICQFCGLSFNRIKALTAHEKFHQNYIESKECKICKVVFLNESSLAKHNEYCIKKESKTSAVKKSSVKCLDTDLRLNNLNETQEEATSFDHPVVRQLPKVSNPVKRHACTDCPKHFTTKQKMYRHMWIHRRKTFSCEVCDCVFGQQTELDEHRLSQHSGRSPYLCQECGKSFSSRQGLWEHGRVHNAKGNANQFHCEECNKKFASRQGYLIHLRTHTGERPYGCRYCWKAFRDGGTLRKHERIHTGERPHSCPICTRAFNQKVVLREHVRWLHAENKTDSNPVFQCELCEQILSDREELCAHIVRHSDQISVRTKTSIMKNDFVDKKKIIMKNLFVNCNKKRKTKNVTPISEPTLTELTEFNFSCDLCGLLFRTRQLLKSHIIEHF